jgi:hypothetical protein
MDGAELAWREAGDLPLPLMNAAKVGKGRLVTCPFCSGILLRLVKEGL